MLKFPFLNNQEQPQPETSQEQRQAEILLDILEKQLEELPVTFEELAENFHDATLRTCFHDGFLLNEINHSTGKSIVRITETGLDFLEDATA